MAYFSQERKQEMAPKIKEICKKYGVKASLAVRHHSTLVLNIKSGKVDFFESVNRVCSQLPRYYNQPGGFRKAEGSLDVNHYWYHEHFDGKALEFLTEIISEMHGPDYYDNSDIQSDYFDCSHYIDVNIGKWNKPYQLTV